MNSVSDLEFFSLLMRHGTLAATAQAMGVTPPAVSKRLQALERRLGVRLLHRTTRRLSLTPEGEAYVSGGARVLADLEALERTVSGAGEALRGLVRVSATLGFGRLHIAPALSRFVRQHAAVDVQLHLSDRPVNQVEAGFDLVIRIGELPDARLTARRLAPNRRLLWAAPAYLAQAGMPAAPRELPRHRCLFIREGDEAYGTWHLSRGARTETVKVHGALGTNDGESALQWALDGQGIVLRSQWAAAPFLRSGRLQQVLPEWHAPSADIHAVYPTRHLLATRTRALVDHLAREFEGVVAVPGDPCGGW